MKKTFLSGILALAVSQALATTLEYKDLNALVDEADGIVSGTVVSVEASRAAEIKPVQANPSIYSKDPRRLWTVDITQPKRDQYSRRRDHAR